MIAAERQRQVESEGWTTEHDDTHRMGEIARVAACYATPQSWRKQVLANGCGMEVRLDFISYLWPRQWDFKWWKPTPGDRIRELVKAGALIAAEIDRLQRVRR